MESLESLELTDIESDADTCDIEEIKTIFQAPYKLLLESNVYDNKYILHLCATLDTNPLIAIGTSDGNVDIHSLNNNQFSKIDSLIAEDGQCIGIKFNIADNNIIYVGHRNGFIKIWDLRATQKPVTVFTDTTSKESYQKSLSCFDAACNNRLISAGTELHEGDPYILFWDLRNTKLLGGYWESHCDDITQVRFHPNDDNKLISSSTDGLINIYDLKEQSEDEALIDCLNTESSIDQLSWFMTDKSDHIYCSTHIFDVQIWNAEQAELYLSFNRGLIAKSIKRKSEDYSYIGGFHINSNEDPFLIVGSNYGDGECMRALTIKNSNLQQMHNFYENKQRIRVTSFNKNTNLLITGGERGIINAWRLFT